MREIDAFTKLVLRSTTGKKYVAVSIGISLRRGILISSNPLVAIHPWSKRVALVAFISRYRPDAFEFDLQIQILLIPMRVRSFKITLAALASTKPAEFTPGFGLDRLLKFMNQLTSKALIKVEVKEKYLSARLCEALEYLLTLRSAQPGLLSVLFS